METRKKQIGCLIAAMAVAAGVLYLFSPLFFTLNRMHRIQHRVDHTALMAACQEMMRNRPTYKTKTFESPPKESHIDLNDRGVPAVIRRLTPSSVVVSDDVMTIEMGGGFGHYGVVAFAHGNDTADRIPGWGQKKRKLIEGLWFYSD
jgi:hypothetical protein